MQPKIEEKINVIIRDGYSLSLPDSLRLTWKIFSKNAFAFVGFFFIIILASTFVQMMPYVGWIVSAVVISPCLYAGFALVSKKLMEGEEQLSFDAHFEGFQFAKGLAPQAAVIFGIQLLLLVPVIMIAYKNGDLDSINKMMEDTNLIQTYQPSKPFIYASLAVIPIYVLLSIIFSFAPFLVLFHEVPAIRAIDLSRKIISKEFWKILGFMALLVVTLLVILFTLVNMLIGLGPIFAILGFVVFAVLLLIVIPLAQILIFTWFEQIVGTSAIIADNLESHLLD